MKNFKAYYTKDSGLTQVGDIQAYCCILKDGFFHLYMDEASKLSDTAFKYINKDSVIYIGE